MSVGPTRIDQLEALAQTILLAIDQLRQRQETFLQDLQTSREQFDRQIRANAVQIAANAERSAINAEQIAANTAGLLELRGILADYLRSRTES
ncbi:MAG: hypothetical protein VKJ64_08215 [Leptolyngbyaceae bacterium]|nr:hypothetical protein [Leptolyngbyaceae bacterium]